MSGGRGWPAWLGVYLRGMAMGVAEVIPGVSGGTIAFVTGIYFELLNSLRALHPRLWVVMRREGFAAVWRQCNATFLLVLGAGMGSAVTVFAHLVRGALESCPIPVWAFFFGLIVASVVMLARSIGSWRNAAQLALLAGVIVGIGVSRLEPMADFESPGFVFVAGAIAVCAWILPGVSGSFILVVLGAYTSTLRAIAEFDIPYLVALAAGCALGLVSFAQLLGWLLDRFRGPALASLTGFMAGSLIKLWPWQRLVTYVIGEDGKMTPVVTEPISPWRFAESTGDDAMLGAAVIAALLGSLLVAGLGLWGRRPP